MRRPHLLYPTFFILGLASCGSDGSAGDTTHDAGALEAGSAADADGDIDETGGGDVHPADAGVDAADAGPLYEATTDSLRSHPVPDWYHDAKLGIMVHWGLYSVPAWAPLTGEFDEVVMQPDGWKTWFRENPYAEWYANTIRIDGSPSREHHLTTWGATFAYDAFAPMFEQSSAQWDAAAWAATFADAGARYVVFVSKHHDGYCLWPTSVDNPNGGPGAAVRDYAGELADATRAEGMHFALYYSGGIDWTFEDAVIEDLADLVTATPQSQAYIEYANAHWRELIERYRPSYLWNDIGYPSDAGTQELIAWYYNTVPEGLINDRFNHWELKHFDVETEEYTESPDIRDQKWETVRGMGFSFGYNQNDTEATTIGSDALIDLLVDVVSKNGNMLLNVGPDAAGEIPAVQLSRLEALGQWLGVHGEAIYGTRPWTRAEGQAT
ncbi:MAG: alpha-L-fucosidase, partial [Myxococcota bacterium]